MPKGDEFLAGLEEDKKDMADSVDETLGTKSDEWEEVVETQADVFAFEKEGDSLVGVLSEVQEDVGENNSMLYKLEKKDGSLVAVWGSTVLDGKMSKIEIGQEIKIVYKGKIEVQNSKRSYRSYDVFAKPVAFKEV